MNDNLKRLGEIRTELLVYNCERPDYDFVIKKMIELVDVVMQVNQ